MFNRILCMLLCVLMLLSVSSGAFADIENGEEATGEASAEALPEATDNTALAVVSEAESALADSQEVIAATEPVPADWTVMIYLCGTDLETKHAMATVNLEEIIKTSPNENVNVVIQTGGTKEWHAQDLGLDIATNKCQRYSFNENGFMLDEEFPLENMASAATLASFIRYSAERYPAEKNLLVLWDHGGGSLSGLIVDEMHNNAIMPLDQLELAMERSGVSFEAVLLDTCLMASLETAQALQSTTHYLIASEETVPGEGSDYKSWLQYLYNMPECTGKQFGRKVCDSAQQKYAQLGSEYDSLTFSVIDLTKLDPVSEAFNSIFAELRTLADAPLNMLRFSASTRRTESYYLQSMIDLGDLTERARGMGISSKTANAMLVALDEAVVYNVKGVDHSYSTGLSFYYDPVMTSAAYYDHYARFSKSAEYLAFIDRVNMRWTAPGWVYDQVEYLPDITYADYGIELETDVTEDGVLHLSVTNGVSSISSIDSVIYSCETEEGSDSERWIRLGHDATALEGDFTTGEFTALIPGYFPTLSGHPCEMKIIAENEDYMLYTISVSFDSYGLCDLLVIYRYETLPGDAEEGYASGLSYDGYYELLGVQTGSSTTLPSRTAYSLDNLEGEIFAPVVTEVFFPYGEEDGTIMLDEMEVSSDLALKLTELPAGRYAYAFSVTNVFGANTLTELFPFTWDGENAVFDYEEPVEESDEVSGVEAGE